MLIAGVLILSGCGDGTTGNTIKITNPIKTCKMVDASYQATEEYQEPLKYEVVEKTKSTTLKGFDVWAVSEVTVKNVDTETGSFSVLQTFSTLNGQDRTLSSKQYIMPGETKTFREEYDIDLGEDFNVRYSVQPPTKTLTRTVTKYRQEEQCN